MPRKGLICLVFSLLPLQVSASNLIELAHKAGFDRCDSAIATEFKDLATQGNGVASTGYFNDRSFNIMATWGDEKDNVWKNTTFIKFGRSCLAYSVIGTTYNASCSNFNEKNPEWGVIKAQGGFTWTRNKGGVNAIMKSLPNGSCEITYRIHQNYDTTSPQPAQDKKKSAKKPSDKAGS
ncbi:hypothetical protein [Endozoicomonas arenosclerae]|uniref:hypothetical protein n=1 Tax=Endozoicomonas arenosclerae TaxID=1633495 RepID=UPI0007832C9C|nr:hypothetical protein [Endozoicomonas arenosclerae]